MKQAIFVTMVNLFIISSSLMGAVLKVPQDYKTVQDALDHAKSGDVIAVSDGTYYENLVVPKIAVTLQSVNGAQSCILDGGSMGAVIESSQGAHLIINGFTITNGTGFAYGSNRLGGGIYVDNGGDLEVKYCTIAGNDLSETMLGFGGGIYYRSEKDEDTLFMYRNWIFKNQASFGGGGLQLSLSGGARSFIIRNDFFDNEAYYDSPSTNPNGAGVRISLYENAKAVVECNKLYDNFAESGAGLSAFMEDQSKFISRNNVYFRNAALTDGGAVMVRTIDNLTAWFINDDFYDNSAEENGGAVYLFPGYREGRYAFHNCIFWKNKNGPASGKGSNIAVWYYSSNKAIFDVTFSDVEEGIGSIDEQDAVLNYKNNINIDPKLICPDSLNFHLSIGSPCIDTGLNSAPKLAIYDFEGDRRALDGNGDKVPVVDMGADEFTIKGRNASAFGN